MSAGARRLPLHVEDLGSVGRPLLLVHGFGANGFTWRHWAPRLAREYGTSIVELKGHGSAPKPRDRRYGPWDHAELLLGLIRRRELESVTLVGHSLGGAIVLLTALRLIERGEDRLHSLAIVAGPAFPQEVPPVIRALGLPGVGAVLLRALPTRALVRRVLRSVVFDPERIEPSQVEAYATPLSTSEGRRALRMTARRIVPPDLDEIAEEIPRIRAPTLLLWGRHDPVVPPSAGRRLGRIIPRARLVVLDACGHVPQEERPRRSLRELLAFLRDLRGDEG